MLRAGLIKKLAAGAYSYLPLGQRALRKASQIVREEMDRTGASEVLLPVIQPAELWQRTGRYETFGPLMMQLKDRQGRALVLGPTHEEVMTDLVSGWLQSYKQLPLTLYQIQTKFRDELRPRFGVLRSREFLMKDAYSFHVTEDCLRREYQVQYQAYARTFDRCGLTYVIVLADTGAMGGDTSHQFTAPTEVGEDTIVSCPCGYAATLERADAPALDWPEEEARPLETIDTPGMTTIEQVSEFLRVEPSRLIKTLIYAAGDEIIVVLVRGDHDVNPAKLARLLGQNVELASPEAIRQATGAPVGFVGPVGLKLRLLADRSVPGMTNAVTGANQDQKHLTGVNPSRDFTLDQVADLRLARAGDACPSCGRPLQFARGIELGQVFQLGTKYAQALGVSVLDEKGREVPVQMGCYGIGVSRILAAAIELHHDQDGIIFPISIAPYEVLITAVNMDDAEVCRTAEEIYESLLAQGADVLYDDRADSPGVKFKDADLIGIPLRLTVGRRALKDGEVELKLRREPAARRVPVDQAAPEVLTLVDQLKGELEPREAR